MATTTHGSLQDSGDEMTRRNVIRWVGRVAVASALTTLGANSLSGPVEASRRGKRRRKQPRNDQSQSVAAKVIETTFLPEDLDEGDPDVAGYRCRKRIVCYSNGVCVRRTICR